MSFVPILDLHNDVKPFFQLACCDADESVMRFLRKTTESQARAFVGHCISQNTISNEYQRRDDIGWVDDVEFVNVQNGKAYIGGYAANMGDVLQLDNGFVRSITDLREDYSAKFGTLGTDFPSDSALSSGDDFYLELDRSGLSKSGRVIRFGRAWSTLPGTVRITYVAGLTKAELDDEWAFVKLALLEEMQEKFNCLRSRRTSGGGPVRKEIYAGDYTVEYDTQVASRSVGDLSPETMKKLQPIRRINL